MAGISNARANSRRACTFSRGVSRTTSHPALTMYRARISVHDMGTARPYYHVAAARAFCSLDAVGKTCYRLHSLSCFDKLYSQSRE